METSAAVSGVEDMCNLAKLDEAAILDNLEKR
jgi:myosin heavy subunit